MDEDEIWFPLQTSYNNEEKRSGKVWGALIVAWTVLKSWKRELAMLEWHASRLSWMYRLYKNEMYIVSDNHRCLNIKMFNLRFSNTVLRCSFAKCERKYSPNTFLPRRISSMKSSIQLWFYALSMNVLSTIDWTYVFTMSCSWKMIWDAIGRYNFILFSSELHKRSYFVVQFWQVAG